MGDSSTGMTLEHLSVETTDRLELPGLLYAPDKPTKKAAVWLHGMGDNGMFYNPVRGNALGKSLTDEGIALLTFNNRGAHNKKYLRIVGETLPDEDDGRVLGTHYELIADCVKDIEGAIKLLSSRGYTTLYLIGHSSGANKICVYDKLAKTNPFSKYVLAGPGDDTGLYYSDLGDRRFNRALDYARKALANGESEHVLPKYTGMHPFSAQAAADILDPDGDYNTFPFFEATTRRLGKKPLFAEYSHITRPAMVVFGENDEYAYTGGGTQTALDLFRKYTNPKIAKQAYFTFIPEADHSFHGHETEFAECVAWWLSQDE